MSKAMPKDGAADLAAAELRDRREGSAALRIIIIIFCMVLIKSTSVIPEHQLHFHVLHTIYVTGWRLHRLRSFRCQIRSLSFR